MQLKIETGVSLFEFSVNCSGRDTQHSRSPGLVAPGVAEGFQDHQFIDLVERCAERDLKEFFPGGRAGYLLGEIVHIYDPLRS